MASHNLRHRHLAFLAHRGNPKSQQVHSTKRPNINPRREGASAPVTVLLFVPFPFVCLGFTTTNGATALNTRPPTPEQFPCTPVRSESAFSSGPRAFCRSDPGKYHYVNTRVKPGSNPRSALSIFLAASSPFPPAATEGPFSSLAPRASSGPSALSPPTPGPVPPHPSPSHFQFHPAKVPSGEKNLPLLSVIALFLS